MTPQIKVAGVLVKNDKILLVQQSEASGDWSLPSGRMEKGETLHQAVIKKMEETGLNVSIRRLLYVADKPDVALTHITFELCQIGGEIRLPSDEPGSPPIHDVKFVAVSDLEAYGFSPKWQNLVENKFPDAPGFVGLKSNIGL